jgi:hypothetical protein
MVIFLVGWDRKREWDIGKFPSQYLVPFILQAYSVRIFDGKCMAIGETNPGGSGTKNGLLRGRVGCLWRGLAKSDRVMAVEIRTKYGWD